MTHTDIVANGCASASLGGRQVPSQPQFKTSRRTLFYVCAIVLLWAAVYGPGLWSPPLMDDADAVHAEASREMLQRSDYVTLHTNGVRYLEKAPLPYWLNAASYKIFGFSELSTRLPLSLLALAAVLAVFFLARDIAGDEAGLYSALILGTAIGPYIYTRFQIPDLIVGLWLTLTVHLLFRSFDQERPSVWLCWGIAATTALNVLTKGLIGVVFPIGILAIYILITGEFGHLRKLRLGSSALIFLAIAAPWHVLATLRNPAQGAAKGFFWFYFINEHLNRYLDKRIPRDYDKVRLSVFWSLILVWLIPWSGYVVAALRQLPLRWRNLRAGMSREQRATLLLLIWGLFILVFFSFSTRQEYYVLPALPAFAALTGIWLAREATSAPDSGTYRLGLITSRVGAVAGGILGVALLALAAISRPLPAGMDFADALRKRPELYALSFGHFFDLTPQAMGAFRTPLLITGTAFLIGTILSWYQRRRLRHRQANVALALMMVFVVYAVHLALITFLPVLGSKALAMEIKHDIRAGDVIVVDTEYSAASTINFYTGRQIHLLNNRKNDLWYGSLFPDCPKVFEDDASFAKLWTGPQRVFFVTYDAEGPKILNRYSTPGFELARSGDKTVFSNRGPSAP